MKICYMDEAGTSDVEPVAIVAGVIARDDYSWRNAAARLKFIATQYCKKHAHRPVVFHAKDIFHGTRDFHRDLYSRTEREIILSELASLPQALSIPIVTGICAKEQQQPGRFNENPGISAHVAAYVYCVASFELLMRQMTVPGEIGLIIAEDQPQIRRHLKETHGYLRGGFPSDSTVPQKVQLLFPLSKIVDTVHFAEKDEAALLQIADVCAFIIGRFMSRKAGSEELLRLLVGSQAKFDVDLKQASLSFVFIEENHTILHTRGSGGTRGLDSLGRRTPENISGSPPYLYGKGGTWGDSIASHNKTTTATNKRNK